MTLYCHTIILPVTIYFYINAFKKSSCYCTVESVEIFPTQYNILNFHTSCIASYVYNTRITKIYERIVFKFVHLLGLCIVDNMVFVLEVHNLSRTVRDCSWKWVHKNSQYKQISNKGIGEYLYSGRK